MGIYIFLEIRNYYSTSMLSPSKWSPFKISHSCASASFNPRSTFGSLTIHFGSHLYQQDDGFLGFSSVLETELSCKWPCPTTMQVVHHYGVFFQNFIMWQQKFFKNCCITQEFPDKFKSAPVRSNKSQQGTKHAFTPQREHSELSRREKNLTNLVKCESWIDFWLNNSWKSHHNNAADHTSLLDQ